MVDCHRSVTARFPALSLNLGVPANDGPASVDAGTRDAPVAGVQDRAEAPPNGMQKSLSAAAAILPTSPPVTEADVPEPAEMPSNPFLTVPVCAMPERLLPREKRRVLKIFLTEGTSIYRYSANGDDGFLDSASGSARHHPHHEANG